MANIISNDNVKEEDYLQMSNGLTGVFIDAICLAGLNIAENEFQKDLMIWFAQRDWKTMGLGIIGFDVSEIIWEKNIFWEQKKFVLVILERAREKVNWDLLSYSPREDWIMNCLQEFGRMIQEFEEIHIDESEQYEIHPFENKYDKCEKHKVFLHAGGCVVCNNE